MKASYINTPNTGDIERIRLDSRQSTAGGFKQSNSSTNEKEMTFQEGVLNFGEAAEYASGPGYGTFGSTKKNETVPIHIVNEVFTERQPAEAAESKKEDDQEMSILWSLLNQIQSKNGSITRVKNLIEQRARSASAEPDSRPKEEVLRPPALNLSGQTGGFV